MKHYLTKPQPILLILLLAVRLWANSSVVANGGTMLQVGDVIVVDNKLPGGSGEYISAVQQVAQQFLLTGLITPEQRNSILTQAAKSSCGQRH